MVTEKTRIARKSSLFRAYKNKILTVFVIWSIWLSLEFLLGPFSHVRIHDAGDSLLPQLLAAKIQFQKYGISYFADYMVAGVDAMAQSLMPFSNFNSTIFMLLPGWLAYGLLMLSQRFIAGYFTYRLLKDHLKIKTMPSIVGGLLFSMFNFSIYSFTLYHALGLPALPLILWFMEKVNNFNNSRRHILIIIFGLFIGFSNYFVYFSPYLLPFLFLWFFYIRGIRNGQTLLNLSIFSLATILPMLPNIFAIMYNSQLSQRTVFNLYRGGISINSAIERIIDTVKSYYLSVLFILFLTLNYKLKNPLSKKLLTSFILLTFTLFIYKLTQPTLYFLPNIIRSFSFDRLELIIPFVLAVSVAVLLNQPRKKIKKVLIVSIVLIFAISLKVKVDTIKNFAPYRSLYLHPDLVALSNNTNGTQWRIATVTGGGARPAYSLSNGLSTVDSYLTLYPKTYHAFWSEVIKKRLAGDKSRWEDYMDWGNRVYLYGPDNFESLESVNFESYYNLELLSNINVKYIISTKPVDDFNLELTNSSYRDNFASWSKKTLSEKIEFFLQGKFYGRPYYVYENKKVLPRFYLKDDPFNLKNSIKVLSYEPDKVVIETNTNNGAKLVASVNNYPWWNATVNGKSVKLQRYLDTFLSVDVDKGKAVVVMDYNPPYKVKI